MKLLEPDSFDRKEKQTKKEKQTQKKRKLLSLQAIWIVFTHLIRL